FFFFQAEDGIRDFHVTGVQTCALPICQFHFVRAAEPLARYTWLGLGGPAQYFAEPTTHEELAHLLSQCNRAGLPVHVLGGGSNRSEERRVGKEWRATGAAPGRREAPAT